jgi:hypothetical protein
VREAAAVAMEEKFLHHTARVEELRLAEEEVDA